MSCQRCGVTREGDGERCSACGAPVDDGCIDRGAGGTGVERLVTDGGQPAEGQTTDGRQADGEVGGGGHGTATGADVDLADLLESLPLRGGAIVGVFAALVPYVLVTVATIAPLQRDQFRITAELYATIVGLGAGERFVDLFVGGTDISALRNVRPEDYPSVEAELDAVLDTLTSNPESLLLILYLLAPAVVYFGGRYLARKHAAGEGPLHHAAVGAPMVLGALLVTVPITLAFGVEAQAGAILVGGLFVPLTFGALGGLTVYAFRDVTWWPSKAYGWLAAAFAILVSIDLFPLLLSGMIEIDAGQRVLFGLMGFLASSSLGFPLVLMGFVLLVLVVAGAVGAGYLRVRRSGESPSEPLAGARLGTSIALGYVPVAAVVLILMPILSLVIPLPFGARNLFAAVLPGVGKFFTTLIRVTLFALAFGAMGGALAVYHQQREDATA